MRRLALVSAALGAALGVFLLRSGARGVETVEPAVAETPSASDRGLVAERHGPGRRVEVETTGVPPAPSSDVEESGAPAPTRLLRGLVVDRHTRVPIVGADVNARTDGRGEFALEVLLRAGRGFLQVRAPGYATLSWWSAPVESTSASTEPLWLPLTRLAWVDGTVRAASGRPVVGVDRPDGRYYPGFRTTLDPPEPLELQPTDAELAVGYSGAGTYAALELFEPGEEPGNFHLGLCPAERGLRVRVTAREGSATSNLLRLARPDERVSIELVLHNEGRVSGQVLCNGQPWLAGRMTWEAEGRAGHGRTSLTGNYSMEVPPGAVVIRAGAWSEPLAEATVEVREDGEATCDLAFEAPTLAGIVTCPSGEPVAGAYIYVREQDVVRTGRDGRFFVQAVPAGRLAIHAGLDGIVARVEVEAGESNVRIVLDTCRGDGELSLLVVNGATGEPQALPGNGMPHLWWRLAGKGSFAPYLDPDTESEFRTGEDGRAIVRLPLRDVDLRFHASRQGFAPLVLGDVEVTREPRAAPLRVELRPGVELHLAFREEAGAESERLPMVLVLEESQLDLVKGPLPPGDPRVNFAGFEVLDRAVLERFVTGRGESVLQGLAPGRYHFLAAPEGTRLDPSFFDLPACERFPLEVDVHRP